MAQMDWKGKPHLGNIPEPPPSQQHREEALHDFLNTSIPKTRGLKAAVLQVDAVSCLWAAGRVKVWLTGPQITHYIIDWINYSFIYRLCVICAQNTHRVFAPLSHSAPSFEVGVIIWYGVDKKPISQSAAPLWESTDFLMPDELKIIHSLSIWLYPVELQREASMSKVLSQRPAALWCWRFFPFLQG